MVKSAVIDCERDLYGRRSKPARAIFFCPWERRYTEDFPLLGGLCRKFFISVISLHKKTKIQNFKQTVTSLHFRKQVGVIACPM